MTLFFRRSSRRGRIAMVDEVQNTERLDVTLKRKEKEVEETRLRRRPRRPV